MRPILMFALSLAAATTASAQRLDVPIVPYCN